MNPDAIIAVTRMLQREWGDYGYHVESLQRYGWRGGCIAVCAHSDGSRFVLLCSDRYASAELVPEGSELAAAALAA